MRSPPISTPQLKRKLDVLCQATGWTHEIIAQKIHRSKSSLAGYQNGTSTSSEFDKVPGDIFPRFIRLLQEVALRPLSDQDAAGLWKANDLALFRGLMHCDTLDDVLEPERKRLKLMVRAEPLRPDRGMLSLDELYEPFSAIDLHIWCETDGLRFEIETEQGTCLFMAMLTGADPPHCMQLVPWKHTGMATSSREFVPPMKRAEPLKLAPVPGTHRFVVIAYKGDLLSLRQHVPGQRPLPLLPDDFTMLARALRAVDASYPWRWGELKVGAEVKSPDRTVR
ncbi:hypothetical protein LJR039_007089 [Pseudorhodoferax sp. LjRoot39]|uniref:hypothetical protein n=1 Tax=Pseudorhodoferax sp. LjRoot39 TaxID=3342328 RepID=UPI003ECEB948